MKNNILAAIILTGFILSMLSCGSDAKPDSIFNSHPQLDSLKMVYDKNQDVQSANDLLRVLQASLSNSELPDDKVVALLTYGYEVAAKENMTSRMANFLFPLIKRDYDNPATPDRIFQLTGIMQKLKKEAVAIVLSQGLQRNFPNYEKLGELTYTLPEGVQNVDDYVKSLGTKIFDNPDNIGINRSASLTYVDACEAFALVFPNDPAAPENLFKAAEVAKSLRTFPKSLTLYDWILESYPDFDKAATALFLKGFIIENNIGDDEKAREVYDEFIAKYPNHDLADDVEFLIENLGKTDEEILQMIEEKRKQNQNIDS